MNNKWIELKEGKYHVKNNNGIMNTKRNGEAWSEMDNNLIGSSFTLSLVEKIEYLQQQIDNMKCCQNCKYATISNHVTAYRGHSRICQHCKDLNKYEFDELTKGER